MIVPHIERATAQISYFVFFKLRQKCFVEYHGIPIQMMNCQQFQRDAINQKGFKSF